jgi:hypothetical protein
MIPVSTNTTTNHKEGCVPMSSSCVIWNGPDIPCINLCKGDSIEKVVYNLATVLCQITEGILDVTTLDFKCLVEEAQDNPTTLIATIQLLIDKVCELNELEAGGVGGIVTTTPTPIPLPECLYYIEDGDTITQLPPDEYSEYLATKICIILETLASVNIAIESMNVRLTIVENTLEAIEGENSALITVQTQCASGTTPGLTLSIQEAFSNFENTFCQLQSLLGSNASLSTAIAKECAGLDSAPQINDQEGIMSELAGWVSTPTTLSQTIVNMWITLCDMRSALQSIVSAEAYPCAVVSPYNVQITELTTNGCKVTWNAPPIALTEAPSGYTIEVYEWNGTTTVGGSIATVSKTYPSIDHTFTSLGTAGTTYIVYVTAQYSCGESLPASAIGKTRISPVTHLITVEDAVKASPAITTVTCNSVVYPAVERLTTVTLINPTTGLPVVNTGATINVVLRYGFIGDCVEAAQENITISILTGQSTGTYNYLGQKPKLCAAPPCTPEYQSYTCGISVSSSTAVFAPSVTIC